MPLMWKTYCSKWLNQGYLLNMFCALCPRYKNWNWSQCCCLPWLLGYFILVSSGQLIQMGLQNRLHFLMVSWAERRWWRLVVRCCCCRRGSSSSERWSRSPLFLSVIVQTLVAVGRERERRGPTVVVVSGEQQSLFYNYFQSSQLVRW